MTQNPAETPLFRMIAANLRASDAPRFLLSLVTLEPGEHKIAIDHPEVEASDSTAWVIVSSSNEIRVRLSFVSNFSDEMIAISQTTSVWHHYLIKDETFHEAKTVEETLPERFDYAVDLNTLAANTAAIEDLCDTCALPRDTTLCNTDAPAPIASEPPFEGVI